MMEKRPQLRIVVAGHVDHGKSTLIGRLLHDAGHLTEGKCEELRRMTARRGGDDVEWSYALDSFQAERDQNITIDTTRIWFRTQQRDYVIIDAPGHREFLKNMISGAAAADAALLVVDAAEGVREQTRRHAYLLHLLGLKQVSVVVNKMDLVDYDSEVFYQVKDKIESYLLSLGIAPIHVIPVSARHGDMIAARAGKPDWYNGPVLMEALDHFEEQPLPVALPLRFPVQDVYKFGQERILVGRIESGTLEKGDMIYFSPTGERAVISSLRVWPEEPDKVKAQAGEAIGITLDAPVFVERGHICSHDINRPQLLNVIRARVFWLNADPLVVGNSYKIRYATHEAHVTVQSIDRVIDTQDLAHNENAVRLDRNDVADVTLRARHVLPVDSHINHPGTGRIVLYRGSDVAGGGVINIENSAMLPALAKSTNIYAVHHLVRYEDRIRRAGHQAGIFWLTGLSGAGKSTLAMLVEKELFARGYRIYVLDGDNIRHGLSADLGFSARDRAENIRRVGEVAALMSEAGLIVITAFISPYQADRDRARQAAPDRFHEIYIKADLSVCEDRDPKGLYRKARAGGISDFTGIDSPYETPDHPDLIVDTSMHDINSCVGQILVYIENHIAISQSEEEKRAF